MARVGRPPIFPFCVKIYSVLTNKRPKPAAHSLLILGVVVLST